VLLTNTVLVNEADIYIINMHYKQLKWDTLCRCHFRNTYNTELKLKI